MAKNYSSAQSCHLFYIGTITALWHVGTVPTYHGFAMAMPLNWQTAHHGGVLFWMALNLVNTYSVLFLHSNE